MPVLIYFLIGFIGAVLVQVYHRLSPIPSMGEVGRLKQQWMREERTALVICTFLFWPVVLALAIIWSIVLLAGWTAKALLRALGLE